MTSLKRMTFNLTGTSFDVSMKTFESLKQLSDKSKLLIEEAQKSAGSKFEIFLEHDPACFAALLHFCRRGELHLPTVVCPQVFKDEMDWWGVEVSALSNCCYNTMVSFLDDRTVVDRFEKGFSYMKKQPDGHALSRTRWQAFRLWLWKTLDRPSSSYLAKAYFVLFLVVLSLSLFSMIVSTHPSFLRDMEIDEWKEALGDRYNDHKNFILQRFGKSGGQKTSSAPKSRVSKRSVDHLLLRIPRHLLQQSEDMQWPRSSFIQAEAQQLPTADLHSFSHAQQILIVHEPSSHAADQGSMASGDSFTQYGSAAEVSVDEIGTEAGHSHLENPSDGNTDQRESTVVKQQETELSAPSGEIRSVRSENTHPLPVAEGKETDSTDFNKGVITTETTKTLEISAGTDPQPPYNSDIIPPDRSRVKRAAAAAPPRTTTASSRAPTTTTTSTTTASQNQTNATDTTTAAAESEFHEYSKYRARLDFLDYLDYTCLIFFTVDFLLRMLTCPKLTRFMRNLLNLSDLIAVVAGYTMVLVEKLLPEEKYSLSHLDLVECLQIFRFVRFFRPLRDVIGFKVLVHSVKASTYELLLLVMFLSSGVVVFSTLVYWCERATMHSIPDAFWWAIVTMTTVGYGDMVPLTFQGKVVGSLCALSGVVLIAITIPVLVNNFLLFYGYAKVIVARQAEAKQREVKEKWQHTANSMLGRPGSGINRIYVHPVADPLGAMLPTHPSQEKLTPSSLGEKRSSEKF